MTATDPVVPRAPEAEPNRHLTVVPEHDGPVLRPARWNNAGYCVICLDHRCTSETCNTTYQTSRWEICIHCDGIGIDTATEYPCRCEGGLVNLTGSFWVHRARPRPARLNFAGWCLWCSTPWCTSQRCIDLHEASRWGVCTDCDGLGLHDLEAESCHCAYGLTQTG